MPINRQWSFYNPPPAILPPNSAMVYGLDDTQGYDSLLTGQYFQFAARLDNGSPAPPQNGNMVFTYGFGSQEAREAGARYGVSLKPLPGSTPVFQGDGAYVYEDKAALPRVQVVGGKRDANGYFLELTASEPPTRVMLLSEEFLPQQLVVADQWYPGWHAYFHDEPVSVTEGPDIFRTLTLTAKQRSEVAMNNPLEMRYEPTAFRVGLYALCLLLGTAAAIAAAALSARLGGNGRR